MGLLSRRSTGRVYWLDRRSRRALTAAGAAAGATGGDDGTTSLHQPWQSRAFGYYNKMGECWNPANFSARAMSKIRLYAARKDANGEEEEIESGWAYDLVQQWQEIPEPYGRLRALIGEGRLCQSVEPDDESGTVVWEFLSPTELRKARDRQRIIRKVGSRDVEYVDISQEGGGDPERGQMRMWRLWRPHPENSGLPDSPFRGVLDLYEQLWWLTLSERADLRNRVVNQGLLLIPDEIEFEAPGADDVAMDDDPEVDPFNELISRVTTIALQNPGSAEAAAPAVVRAEAELLHPDKFRILKFHDPSSSLYMTGREQALTERIALGLDMPKEAMLGLGGVNHWTAWKIDDEKFQYVKVEIDALADDLTHVVLRPIGRASNQSDAEEIYVAADVAELVSDPDKGKTAIVLHKDGVLSGEATRQANDFDENDAMGDDERAEWLAIQLRDASLIGGEEAGDTAPDAGGGDETPVDQREEPPAETEPEGQASGSGLALRFAHAAAGLAAANVASWLRSKRRSCPDCVAAIDGVADADVVSVLGVEGLRSLGVTLDQVTARQRDVFYRALGQFGCALDPAAAADVETWFAMTILLPEETRGPIPDSILATLSP